MGKYGYKIKHHLFSTLICPLSSRQVKYHTITGRLFRQKSPDISTSLISVTSMICSKEQPFLCIFRITSALSSDLPTVCLSLKYVLFFRLKVTMHVSFVCNCERTHSQSAHLLFHFSQLPHIIFLNQTLVISELTTNGSVNYNKTCPLIIPSGLCFI